MRKRKFWILLIIALICVSAGFALLWISLPQQLNLIAGEESRLSSYDLPLSINLPQETVGVWTVDQEPVEENIRVSLADSVTVKASEVGQTNATVSLFGFLPVKTVQVNVLSRQELVPCGTPIGVTLDSAGVLVLGTGAVNRGGQAVEPSKGLLRSGDLILSVNGRPISEKEELAQAVSACGGTALNLTIRREGQERQVSVTPEKGASGYQLGVWVRDSAQGIGTLTYYDPSTGNFGALGHGVYDVDTKSLMEISDGSLYVSRLTGIHKGQKGQPGELLGMLDKSQKMGQVALNTEYGLYGMLSDRTGLPVNAVPIGLKQEVEEGAAVVRTSLVDGVVRDYAVQIENVNRTSLAPDKGMVIRITDETLLAATGGIIQGMSGSPILQNGRLIGAVTHVFVQDPTKGYGIFIENMLTTAQT